MVEAQVMIWARTCVPQRHASALRTRAPSPAAWESSAEMGWIAVMRLRIPAKGEEMPRLQRVRGNRVLGQKLSDSQPRRPQKGSQRLKIRRFSVLPQSLELAAK